jgi:hypothetical protein
MGTMFLSIHVEEVILKYSLASWGVMHANGYMLLRTKTKHHSTVSPTCTILLEVFQGDKRTLLSDSKTAEPRCLQ